MVVNFLNGNSHEMTVRITQQMNSFSAKQHYEMAARAKSDMVFCRAFTERQKFLNQFKDDILVVTDDSMAPTDYCFIQGRLDSEPNDQNVDIRFIHDKGNIVYNWIRKNSDHVQHKFINSQG